MSVEKLCREALQVVPEARNFLPSFCPCPLMRGRLWYWLCSKVAKLIRGKYKPTFTPHVDCGDNVIIINAAKVVFSGKKETDKIYTRYTGYPGGQRFNTPADLRTRPNGIDKMLRHAIKGMLPKGPLGRSLMDNVYIFEGAEHNKAAQQPKNIDINQYK